MSLSPSRKNDSIEIVSKYFNNGFKISDPIIENLNKRNMLDKTTNWQAFSLSDKGNVRKYNEDACLIKSDIRLWAVADGMGGHQAGDVASELIMTRLNEVEGKNNLSDYVDLIDDTLITANQQLRQLGQEKYDNQTIGSTAVCMLAVNQYIAFLWAGDSRLYRIRDGKLKQLTQDHSEVQNMVNQGILLAEDAEAHPASNIITRAIGAADYLYVSVGVDETINNDVYILCSDGLYRDINENEMLDIILQSDGVEQSCNNLMQLALSREAKDNITTIILKSNC